MSAGPVTDPGALARIAAIVARHLAEVESTTPKMEKRRPHSAALSGPLSPTNATADAKRRPRAS